MIDRCQSTYRAKPSMTQTRTATARPQSTFSAPDEGSMMVDDIIDAMLEVLDTGTPLFAKPILALADTHGSGAITAAVESLLRGTVLQFRADHVASDFEEGLVGAMALCLLTIVHDRRRSAAAVADEEDEVFEAAIERAARARAAGIIETVMGGL